MDRNSVGNIKQIPQPGRIGAGVKYRCAVRTTLYPTACVFIPVVHVRHGGGGGVLCIN